MCGVRAAASSWVEFIHCMYSIISSTVAMIVDVSLLLVLYYLLFIFLSSPQKHNVLTIGSITTGSLCGGATTKYIGRKGCLLYQRRLQLLAAW